MYTYVNILNVILFNSALIDLILDVSMVIKRVSLILRKLLALKGFDLGKWIRKFWGIFDES